MALYISSRPPLVRVDGPPPTETCKNSSGVVDLGGLLDGRVEPKPVYQRLLYGFGPFRGSVRHALSWGEEAEPNGTPLRGDELLISRLRDASDVP